MNTIRIKGMSCQHCVASTKDALEKITGITDVTVNLGAGEAKYDGDIDPEIVKDAITKIGFEIV